MRISYCIDARCQDGVPGGVQQVLIGLAKGFSQLQMQNETIRFLTYEDQAKWLQPFLGGSASLLKAPRFEHPFKKFLKKSIPWISHFRQRCFPVRARAFVLDHGNPAFDKSNSDLIHFALQQGFATSIPSVFTPHDLQHLHFPEFFTHHEFDRREWLYRKLCAQAELVTAMTINGKADLQERYSIPGSKIVVIPWAAATEAYKSESRTKVNSVKSKLNLPSKFLFYPAQTYPHKNHINLLKALHLLKQKGLEYTLVCTGRKTNYFRTIAKCVADLDLRRNVRFLGYLSPSEVSCLYELGSTMVFPSLFEGWGLPILESFLAQMPVCCSAIPTLRALSGGASHLFDPRDPAQIANAIYEVETKQSLRADLVAAGISRVSQFSWKLTARNLLAHYRFLLNIANHEDQHIMNAPALV